jgi:hypothetical protein
MDENGVVYELTAIDTEARLALLILAAGSALVL